MLFLFEIHIPLWIVQGVASLSAQAPHSRLEHLVRQPLPTFVSPSFYRGSRTLKKISVNINFKRDYVQSVTEHSADEHSNASNGSGRLLSMHKRKFVETKREACDGKWNLSHSGTSVRRGVI